MKTVIKLSLCFSLCLIASDYVAAASITTTNIVPAVPTPSTPPTPPTIVSASSGNYTISGGQPLGTDTLLETFTSFNLASPDTVTFANSAGYTNLIVRVTGGLSTIDGQMTSLIPNLYFINPAGVTFGPNAVIDVPGAFHVSTADKMTFNNYLIDTHSADAATASTLTIPPPDSFGFLGTNTSSTVTFNTFTPTTTTTVTNTDATTNTTTITTTTAAGTIINSTTTTAASNTQPFLETSTTTQILPLPLSVSEGKTFDVVANNIKIEPTITIDQTTKLPVPITPLNLSTINTANSPTLSAPAGQMRLVAFKGVGDVKVDASTLPEQNLSATNSGDIIISDGGKVISEGGYTRLWGGNIDINNGSVSASSTTSSGSVTVIGDTLNITNAGIITTSTTSTSGNTPAGNIDVKTNTLNIIGKNVVPAVFTGISSSSNPGSSGLGGTVTVSSDVLNIQNGGAIRTATFTDGDAGDTTVTANVLTIDGQGNTSTATGITSRANAVPAVLKTATSPATPSNPNVTGNAGTVLVTAGNLTILNAGQISTDTFTIGNAGTVTVNANSLVVDGVVSGNPSKISSGSRSTSKGYTGDVSVTASNSIQLTNGGNIGIQSLVTNHTGAIAPLTDSAITITAPDISLTNSKITSSATTPAGTGIDNAGNINVNFSHWLTMNSSFITTTANKGNGGIITINGGEAIYLENSGFLTSVSGATSNGGNINVNADALIMNTAVIQANAVGGSGGDINIALKALIPSQNRLILGGSKVLWQPYIPGFNVIQAASESGVSGTVNVNSPQFDISGSVSGLDTSGLVLPSIAQNPCASQGTRSSSLARGSKGGIPVSESKAGFIPAAGALPNDTKAKTAAVKDLSDATFLPTNSVIAQNKSTCAPI